jgi:hypothetical protein
MHFRGQNATNPPFNEAFELNGDPVIGDNVPDDPMLKPKIAFTCGEDKC